MQMTGFTKYWFHSWDPEILQRRWGCARHCAGTTFPLFAIWSEFHLPCENAQQEGKLVGQENRSSRYTVRASPMSQGTQPVPRRQHTVRHWRVGCREKHDAWRRGTAHTIPSPDQTAWAMPNAQAGGANQQAPEVLTHLASALGNNGTRRSVANTSLP